MPQIQTQPYNRAIAVTLSDTVNIDGTTYSATAVTKAIPCEALFVGTKGATGTMVVAAEDGTLVTFVGISAGQTVPFKAIRVNNTTTDVSNVRALYTV